LDAPLIAFVGRISPHCRKIWFIEASMIKNPYGLLNGKLVTVDQVPSGLACGCVCPNPGCGARLVARHCDAGRESNFAHHAADECQASYESALHILAKEILGQRKRLMLPELKIESSRAIQRAATFRQRDILVKRQLFRFDRAELEVRMEGRIPDVVLYKSSRRLLVEIVVTHDITAEKLEWIRQQNLATVKVFLGWADRAIRERQLRKCLETGKSRFGDNIVTWVHHPKQMAAQEQLDEQYLRSLDDGTVVRPSNVSPALSAPPNVRIEMPPVPIQRRLFD
jgi:hypothetical protein